MQTEHPAHVAAGETFARHLHSLLPAARLNCAAVEAVTDPGVFDHSSEADRYFAPEVLALGFTQLVHLHRVLVLAALDLECASACVEAEQLS